MCRLHLACLAVASRAAAAAAASASFTVDVAGAPAAVRKTIYDSFGSAHAAVTLRSTYRQHLTSVRDDIPFSHVRFHGILDDDMSTYASGPGNANPYLSFDTLDFLLSQGVRPLVELSFMPKALASDPTLTTFHYAGGISPPKDWAAWRAFVTGLVSQFVTRYGVEEVRQWRFEVWNGERSDAGRWRRHRPP